MTTATEPPAAVAASPTGRAAAPRFALAPGFALCAALAWLAVAIADLRWVQSKLHVGALLLVILLGMAWRSLVHVPESLVPGIRFVQRPVLRWAVAGLGFRLGLGELWAIGAPALAVVTISTFAALGFGWWIARRLGVGEKLALLLGVGGAICGASAVVAADTVVQGEKRDSAFALGVITLLGTLGIVVYPLLQRVTGMSDFLYGLWDGASLHEMAQVVAAGFGVSDEAARVATVVKLARIALLAPVVLGLGWWLRRRSGESGTAKVAAIPWFLVLFLVFAIVQSSGLLPPRAIEWARRVDLWLLCVGMAGVGLQTGFHDLRRAGAAPILAGALQWVFLSGLSYGLARLFVGR